MTNIGSAYIEGLYYNFVYFVKDQWCIYLMNEWISYKPIDILQSTKEKWWKKSRMNRTIGLFLDFVTFILFPTQILFYRLVNQNRV